ncbi:MAG: MscL family protein [Anaeroplasma sp.]|uniref:MscL family protein n=1 Tax=Anaeroplasma sp. TaxID=1872523 RepID=UPI002A91F5E3|nr:MscL family protein [Anaeroplasma sp.]MDY5983207.1 MscL family protein [Anaeroplasma sp.]
MKKFFAEFKTFIARGNVLDMAVGVVIGGAFSAIVNALVNILLSVCTWAVPGGLKGLVTVLPAANDMQRGMNEAIGLGQSFQASELQNLGYKLAETNYAAQIAENQNYLKENSNLIESAKSTILSKYTLHGTTYTYNLSAVIDWGTFINAIISFLIVAFVLFLIVKTFNKMREAQEKAKAKLKSTIDEKIQSKGAEAASDNQVETEVAE